MRGSAIILDVMSELRFSKIEEYIFAPFDTFVYVDEDRLLFEGHDIRTRLCEELNKGDCTTDFPGLKIEWCLEDSEDFKLSKGVFSPPGVESSFIMAQITSEDGSIVPVPIAEAVDEMFPEGSLSYNNVRFYFQDCGVGTCSIRVDIEGNDGLSIVELEQISEAVNNLFKQYFEALCFKLAKAYICAVRELDVPRHNFAFVPEIDEIDRVKHFIPWTHRIYHIPDDTMFDMDNPGEPFRTLMTPSRKMDIEDLSIYDNRWIYFGWGHSLIFTHSEEDGYSQTSRPVYDYVRLVEIAQANWQFLDIVKDIVTFAIASFNRTYETMAMEDLQESIDEIRAFKNGIDRILAYYRGVKITFDTEKRVLLRELNERWLTASMLENLNADLDRIEILLDQLYQRQMERRDESLNTIALLFTIVGIIEVIVLFIDILSPIIELHPLVQLSLVAIGTITIAIVITIYLRRAQRG